MPPRDGDVNGVGGEMGREYELKFRCPDHEAVRRVLREQGGVPVSRVQECNRLFDRVDGSLRAGDCGLRVRSVTPLDGAAPSPAVLTFKGPRAAGLLKVREEIETHVEDAAALATILTRLGYRAVVEFEKRRETWQLADCLVTLDELPQLGGFLEIEGPGEAAIAAVRGQLPLAQAGPLRETYVELIARHVRPAADGILRLTF